MTSDRADARPAVPPCDGSQDTGEYELLTLDGEDRTGPLRRINRLAVMDRAVSLGVVE